MPRVRTSRLRTIAAAIFLPCVVALAACESRPSPTAPQEPQAPRVEGTTDITGAGLVVQQLDSSDPQAVLDYWTPERMQSARPVELLQAPGSFHIANLWRHLRALRRAGHWTGTLGPRAVALHPHASIGKVFFKLFGFDFVCSASAVTTEGRWGEGPRNLVVTAGHCLSDGGGTFASSFIFVPGYFRGNAPLGRWPAERVFTTSAWHFGFGLAFSRDVAFAQLAEGTGEYAGLELHDVVDPLGIVFTEKYPQDGIHHAVGPRKGTRFGSVGYGVANWGGEDQVLTLARVSSLDPNFFPSPIGMPSTHTGGSSGGPWLYRYVPTRLGGRHAQRNLINSVNAYVYGGVDEIYGPQFDDQIHSLWMFAATH